MCRFQYTFKMSKGNLEKALLESSDSETEDVVIRTKSETEGESGRSDYDLELLPNEEMEAQVLASFVKLWTDKIRKRKQELVNV